MYVSGIGQRSECESWADAGGLYTDREGWEGCCDFFFLQETPSVDVEGSHPAPEWTECFRKRRLEGEGGRVCVLEWRGGGLPFFWLVVVTVFERPRVTAHQLAVPETVSGLQGSEPMVEQMNIG